MKPIQLLPHPIFVLFQAVALPLRLVVQQAGEEVAVEGQQDQQDLQRISGISFVDWRQSGGVLISPDVSQALEQYMNLKFHITN